jgi:hypothetical protein
LKGEIEKKKRKKKGTKKPESTQVKLLSL